MPQPQQPCLCRASSGLRAGRALRPGGAVHVWAARKKGVVVATINYRQFAHNDRRTPHMKGVSLRPESTYTNETLSRGINESVLGNPRTKSDRSPALG